MRMLFEFADGTEYVVCGESEEWCVADAMEYTDKHGEIVYYTELLPDDDFMNQMYAEDGIYE